MHRGQIPRRAYHLHAAYRPAIRLAGLAEGEEVGAGDGEVKLGVLVHWVWNVCAILKVEFADLSSLIAASVPRGASSCRA